MTGDQPCQDLRNCRAQIDRPVIIAISTRPRFRWNEVCNRGTYSGSVKICKETNDECRYRNEGEVTCQPQGNHKDGGDEETHQHDRAATQAVSQFTATELGNK